MGCTRRPLHRVRIKSNLVDGEFPVAVCFTLPVSGIALLLSNNIAGGRVVPCKSLDRAFRISLQPDDVEVPKELPSHVVRRTQKRGCTANKRNGKVSMNLISTLSPKLIPGDGLAAAVSESPAFDIVAKAARQNGHNCQVVGKPNQPAGHWRRDVDAGRL